MTQPTSCRLPPVVMTSSQPVQPHTPTPPNRARACQRVQRCAPCLSHASGPPQPQPRGCRSPPSFPSRSLPSLAPALLLLPGPHTHARTHHERGHASPAARVALPKVEQAARGADQPAAVAVAAGQALQRGAVGQGLRVVPARARRGNMRGSGAGCHGGGGRGGGRWGSMHARSCGGADAEGRVARGVCAYAGQPRSGACKCPQQPTLASPDTATATATASRGQRALMGGSLQLAAGS